MHLTDKLRILFREENRLRLIILLGITGIAMILLSGLLPKKQNAEPRAEPSVVSAETDPDAYRILLEERLTDLLSHMNGVGTVTVMITVGGSAEQIYAAEIHDSHSENTSQTSSAPVLTRSNGDESALLTEIRYPAVCGAAILCTGGGHAAVQERVAKAVSALLGIPVNQIYVGQASGFSDNRKEIFS